MTKTIIIPAWIYNIYQDYIDKNISKQELIDILQNCSVGYEEIACKISNLILTNRISNYQLITR